MQAIEAVKKSLKRQWLDVGAAFLGPCGGENVTKEQKGQEPEPLRKPKVELDIKRRDLDIID